MPHFQGQRLSFMTQVEQLSKLLDKLEVEMQANGTWQTQAPSESALMSVEPFAIDTLLPHEWLQWIFIPQMRFLITQNSSLPAEFSMAAYFEESWKTEAQFCAVIRVIQQIDKVSLSC